MNNTHYKDQPRVPKGNKQGGQFTSKEYNAMSIDELKKIAISKPRLLKMDMQFFTEKDIKNQNSNSLKRSMRKFRDNIALHQDKIDNPQKYIPDWDALPDFRKAGAIKWWKREIRNYTNSYNERVDELKKRGDYDDE